MRNRRAVMLTDLPPGISPSAYVNGYQLVPRLAENGWDLQICPTMSDAVFRYLQGHRVLRGAYQRGYLRALRVAQIAQAALHADVVIVHKAITSMTRSPVFERMLRRCHHAIVFNFDDAVNETGIPFLPDRIALADAVWVGRPPLVDYAKTFCHHVELIESAVDTHRYRPATPPRLPSVPTLVWTGTRWNFKYLRELCEPLSRIARRTRFRLRIISRDRVDFLDPRIDIEWHPFDHDTEPELLRTADIGLAPLTDGVYERAKENYKVKLYLASGLPIVCSPVGANLDFVQDGVRGLQSRTANDWVDNISALLDDGALRRKMGAAGRTFAIDRFAIPLVSAKLANLFDCVR